MRWAVHIAFMYKVRQLYFLVLRPEGGGHLADAYLTGSIASRADFEGLKRGLYSLA
jgi:hypothetical protein